MEKESFLLEENSEQTQNYKKEQTISKEYKGEAMIGMVYCLKGGDFDDAIKIRDEFLEGDEQSFLVACRTACFEWYYTYHGKDNNTSEIIDRFLKNQDEFINSEETKQIAMETLLQRLNNNYRTKPTFEIVDLFLSKEENFLRSQEVEEASLNTIINNLKDGDADQAIELFQKFLSHKPDLKNDPRILEALEQLFKEGIHRYNSIDVAKKVNDFFSQGEPHRMFDLTKESMIERLINSYSLFDKKGLDVAKKVIEYSAASEEEISELYIESASRFLANIPAYLRPEEVAPLADHTGLRTEEEMIRALISTKDILLPNKSEVIQDKRIIKAAITAFETCLARTHLSAAVFLRDNLIPKDSLPKLIKPIKRNLIRIFEKKYEKYWGGTPQHHPKTILYYHDAFIAGNEEIIKDPEVVVAASKYISANLGYEETYIIKGIFIPKELDEFVKSVALEDIASRLKHSYVGALSLEEQVEIAGMVAEKYLTDEPEPVQKVVKEALIFMLSDGDIIGCLKIAEKMDNEKLMEDADIREAAKICIRHNLINGRVKNAAMTRDKFFKN